jgi:transcriptional regulator with XRE-family HTH domain
MWLSRAVLLPGPARSDAASVEASIVPRRTNRSLADELPTLVKEHGITYDHLAALVDVSPSHLSRIIHRKNSKIPSGDLARRIALALELPEDYFPEFRQAVVVQRLGEDAALLNRTYDAIRRRRR